MLSWWRLAATNASGTRAIQLLKGIARSVNRFRAGQGKLELLHLMNTSSSALLFDTGV
jgi:hypothetical protein